MQPPWVPAAILTSNPCSSGFSQRSAMPRPASRLAGRDRLQQLVGRTAVIDQLDVEIVLLEESVIDRDRQRRETDRAGVPGQFQLPRRAGERRASEAVLQIGNCEKSIAGALPRGTERPAHRIRRSAPQTPPRPRPQQGAAVQQRTVCFSSLDICLLLSTGKALPSAQRDGVAARYRSTLTISEIGSISANFELRSVELMLQMMRRGTAIVNEMEF